jgi:hypothetical protein
VKADAQRKVAAYEVLRDDLIEQLIQVDLTSSTRIARQEVKEALARARRHDVFIRTPDSLAVILSSRSGAEGRDAVVNLQRDITYEL